MPIGEPLPLASIDAFTGAYNASRLLLPMRLQEEMNKKMITLDAYKVTRPSREPEPTERTARTPPAHRPHTTGAHHPHTAHTHRPHPPPSRLYVHVCVCVSSCLRRCVHTRRSRCRGSTSS
jgi:hypothetical protein